ncbi:hypothetical protein D3C87_1543860 [compost metagenome]
MLDEVPTFLVPEIFPDVGVDRLAGLVPASERGGQRAFGGETDGAVQGYPAHQPRVQEVMLLTAHFPDAHIFLLPGFADLINHFHGVFPALMGDGVAVFIDQVHRVHQFAEDVELDLIISLIANTHWHRAAMAGQVRQFGFRQLLATVDAVEDVDFHRLAVAIADPPAQPAHVVVGFLDVSQAHEGVHGK